MQEGSPKEPREVTNKGTHWNSRKEVCGKRSRRVPDSWQPNDGHRELARRYGRNLELELARFRDHEWKEARLDWSAAFRNWLRPKDWEHPAQAAPPVQRGTRAGDDPMEWGRRLNDAARTGTA